MRMAADEAIVAVAGSEEDEKTRLNGGRRRREDSPIFKNKRGENDKSKLEPTFARFSRCALIRDCGVR